MATAVDYGISDSDDDFVTEDSEDSDFDFDQENVAPIPKNVKPVTKRSKAVKKKANGPLKILSERSVNNDNNQNIQVDSSTDKSGKKVSKKKTVEEMYQKKSQLEHILLRPDTYVGSVERITQEMYVFEGKEIIEKEITYTPGLYKIYDEILVNAADNKQRDTNMDKLNIVINPEENVISVQNNGKGIPVVIHKEHNCYVPTLIFGHLLTGSNFDDEEKKTTGGRNGYGAKLANIFSKKFVVECVDVNTGLKFQQTFRDNMSITEEPKIKKVTTTEKKRGDYVKISFSPDLERFKMSNLDNDTVSLLSKRAYDIAGSMSNRPGKKLLVTLNGNKVPAKTFQSYLKFYKGVEEVAAYEQIGDRWEVGASVSDGTFHQISFVNAICTSKGGQHVNYIADQVTKGIVAAVKKKNKGGVSIKESQIKNYLSIFVNCLVDNPAFDSQTKENLTTRKTAFGSKCILTEKFLKKVEKSGVVDRILAFAKFKEKQDLQKKGGTRKKKLTGIVKLDDANFAGGAKGKDCTLILTEGDSAKSLAMSGLSIVGRDYYGVFPLKGKPLNVRDAKHQQIMKNEEIKNLIDIMGLKFDTVYTEENIKTLRYGHLMVMADQDFDGSHIKGLIINFIHVFWPSLLNIKGFLQQFITPIVKATKGKTVKTFFTVPEYESWKESTGNDAKGWNVKYYKGLGTSTSAEAKDYFSHLNLHEINFESISSDASNEASTASDEMGVCEVVAGEKKSGSQLIDMAFNKKLVQDRKEWLNSIEKDTFLNYADAQEKGVTYSEFINKELILFSQHDNHRSIAHVFDGFKPSQRKVIFACILKNMKSEIKVAQLCGYIGEKASYHHGEASLNGTVVNMAQDFVGSNNINLLTPAGQFGTRRMGGKDSASPRYIFTKLEKITRAIFHPADDALLNYLNDDGQSIEPEFYMPVIPMALVNGSDGIGTGWSTNVPNFCPRQIIYNVRCLINDEEMEPMHPNYYGFSGTLEANSKKSKNYNVIGKIERKDDTTLHISELPIKKWTQDYKMFLEGMLSSNEKGKEPEIKDFTENHTDSTVSFTISAAKENIDQFESGNDGLLGKFKLMSTISTSNMNFFNIDGRITKYECPEDIMRCFYPVRLEYYVKRKEHLLKILHREKKMLSNKARFVEEVCSGDLVVSNRKRKEILSDLKSRGYDLLPKESDKYREEESDVESDVEDDENEATLVKGYEYLLGMKIWSLTFEKAEQLRNELAKKTEEVSDLESTAPTQIWLDDLDSIEAALDERDNAFAEAMSEELEAQNKSKARQRLKKPRKRVTKAKPKKVDLTKSNDLEKSVLSKGKETKQMQVVEIDSELVDTEADKVSEVTEESYELNENMTEDTSIGGNSENGRKRSPDLPAPKKKIMKQTKKKPAKKQPAKKQPAKKKAAKKKAAAVVDVLSSDDEIFDEDSDKDDEGDESNEGTFPTPPPRSRSTRAKKVVQYVDMCEDSESDYLDE